MSNKYELAVGILATSSIVLTCAIIIVSCYIEQLKKHPGGLVICQYFSILVYNLHFILIPTMGVYYSFRKINSVICDCLSIFFIQAYFLTWNFNTCLSIEVCLKVRKITNTSYSRRLKIYHLSSWITASILTGLIGGLQSFGATSYESCFIKKDTKGHYFALFPIVLNFPLILAFSILSIKSATKSFEPLMIGLSISNLLVASTLAVSNIFTFIELFKDVTELDIHIGAAIGACSGIVLSGSRLLSRSLYLKLKKKLRRSKKPPLIDFTYEEIKDESSEVNFYRSNIWNLSLLFDNLTRKTVAELLITLFIRFKEENLEFYDKKFLISYSAERYQALAASVPYIKTLYKDNSIIIEYFPSVFHSIRKKAGFSSANICSSLIDSDNFTNIKVEGTNQGGKSSSFFFTSSDGRIIIKTIKRSERKTFLSKMLKNYTSRIQQSDSKLVRVLGVFKSRPADVSFVMMERIVPKNCRCFVYDLKGYVTANRTGDLNTLKDADFVERFRGLEEPCKTDLLRVLREDLMVLRDLEVMDYSVLVVDLDDMELYGHSRYLVNGSQHPVLVGIIDFFQEFNLKKSAEARIKKIFSREEVSCVPPSDYYVRILAFLMRFL